MIELVVVIAVLVIVAGIAVGKLEGTQDHAGRTTTEATLRSVQLAIIGTPADPGYESDTREMPREIEDLFVVPTHLPLHMQSFDQVAKKGWNGPYLQPTGARAAVAGPIAGALETVPAVLDGWRNPISLQRPDPDGEYWRVVSAGPNGTIETSPFAWKLDPFDSSHVGDDIVLFLTWIPESGA